MRFLARMAGSSGALDSGSNFTLYSVNNYNFMKLIALSIALFLVPTCHHKPLPPVNVTPTTATQPKVEAIQSDRESVAAANVQAAQSANAANPAGSPKEAVNGALSVAKANLPDPKPEHAAQALATVNLALAGDLANASKAWAAAIAEGAASKAKLEEAQRTLEAERIANAKALRERDELLQETIRKKDAEIAAQAERAKNAVLKDQVLYLNIAGGLFALGFGLLTAFGGIAALRAGGWVLLPLSLLAFGLAQIVGQWWFLWAVLVAVLIAAGVFGWIAWKHKSVAAAADAFKPVLKVLDQAYDGATAEAKQAMDAAVFDPISKLMDKSQKATVHEIRASDSVKN